MSPWRWLPSRRRLAPFALLGAIALSAGGGVWFYLALDRAETERQVLREVAALADTMSAQADAVLGGLDQMLLGIGAAPTAATLALQEGSAPSGVTLVLLAPDGQVLQATPAGHRILAGIASGTLAARIQALPPTTPARESLVEAPLHSTSGAILPMLHRLADGRVAVALLPSRLLERFYARLQLGPGSSVTLMDGRMRLLARIPAVGPEVTSGPIGGPPDLTEAIADRRPWSGILSSPLDGQIRFVAMRSLPSFPLSIGVGLGHSQAMARWHQRATLGAALTLLLIGAAGLALLLLERESRRHLADQAAATERLNRLAEGSAGMAARTELPALLGYITRLTREVLAVPYACVTLHEETPSTPAQPQQASTNDPDHPFPPATLLALGHWSARKESLSPRALPATPDGTLPARLGIAMPCEHGGVLGTLTVASRAAGFSADEEATLAQLARFAGIAIRNRRLLAAAQRAAEVASTARQRAEHLLESMEEGFLALDAAWCVTHANAAALRLMAHPLGLPPGQPLWSLFPVLADLPVFDQLHAVASHGTPRHFEQQIPGSRRWFRVNAFAAGDGVALFFHDLATRHPAPHAGEEATRLLANGMAREFGAIQALIGRLSARPGDAPRPDHQAATLRIQEAAERGSELARQLLPPPVADAPASSPPSIPRQGAGQEHVLLVEDEAPLRANLARQLGRMGFQVTALEGGPAALAALESGLRPDVLLSDVIMPGGISGPRLATLARQQLPGLPVLLMSGYALEEEDTHPTGEALMAKPCAAAALSARLRSLMYGERKYPA